MASTVFVLARLPEFNPSPLSVEYQQNVGDCFDYDSVRTFLSSIFSFISTTTVDWGASAFPFRHAVAAMMATVAALWTNSSVVGAVGRLLTSGGG